jgi:hypothetical protein
MQCNAKVDESNIFDASTGEVLLSGAVKNQALCVVLSITLKSPHYQVVTTTPHTRLCALSVGLLE